MFFHVNKIMFNLEKNNNMNNTKKIWLKYKNGKYEVSSSVSGMNF